ncbi:MAG: ArsR/SmtB family transcription factor [Bradyrhizobium sp.]
MAVPKVKVADTSINVDEMADRAHLASEFLKALAHESRLLILCLLAEGEKSVGQLEELLSQRQSTVSQQLARLRLDGLVLARRDGKTIFYSLADEKVQIVLQALYKAFCANSVARRR